MLLIKNSCFIKSTTSLIDMPKDNKIEIAFVGRSNVGKSSLINDLCNQKIALTSSTPGKTRSINFFLINNSFYFVDLPGYGYAKITKSSKEEWPKMIGEYIEKRKNLKAILFLFDSRREPEDDDLMIIDWFRTLGRFKLLFVLTKSDKLNKSQINEKKLKISKIFNINENDINSYSVLKKTGRVELLKSIERNLF